jgi:lipoprotein-releasing system permease protein
MSMNVPLLIARRYLFSKKKKNFINIISIISVIAVTVGTAALIIVLSVFNGLEQLTIGLHTAYNPQLKIAPVQGKSFPVNDSLLAVLKSIDGVKAVTEVMEDNALLRYGDVQMAVNVKGVSENFSQQYDLGAKLVSGEYSLYQRGHPRALLGVGVQIQLAVDMDDDMKGLFFWYPRRRAKVNLTDPMNSFTRELILPGGVLAIEQQFDNNMVLVPLAWADQLMEYGNRRTSLEVKATHPELVPRVQAALRSKLGPGFTVLNSREQQASILRAVQIERLFVFVALSVVVAVASINIFFSLTMLAIEKQKDIAVLFSLGAGQRLIRRIFLAEGMMIALFGTLIGLGVGFGIVYLQQQFGFVGLGVTSQVIQAYPVKLVATDFLAVGLTVVAITLLAAYFPARGAAQVNINEHL